MSDTIERNKVVLFHFTLKDVGNDGAELGSSRDSDPTACLIGANNVMPGLEKALKGHATGDQFQVRLKPEDAYGQYDSEAKQRVPAKHIGDVRKLKVGDMVRYQTNSGQPARARIAKVGRFNVDLDLNHPLAGKELEFDIEIVEVRDSTQEERSHGHVHGPGGVNH